MTLAPHDLDELEAELRQLAGVLLVGFAQYDDELGVLVAVDADTDADAVRADVARISGRVDGAVRVEVHGGRHRGAPATGRTPAVIPSGARVQLLGVTATPGGERVEVHLSHGLRRVVVDAAPGDALGVAAAVVGGLGELGLPVPYEASAVHLLPDELGGGIIALLRHTHLGVIRRGLSGGRWLEEAVARAVLDALNRTLAADAGAPAERRMVDLRGA